MSVKSPSAVVLYITTCGMSLVHLSYLVRTNCFIINFLQQEVWDICHVTRYGQSETKHGSKLPSGQTTESAAKWANAGPAITRSRMSSIALVTKNNEAQCRRCKKPLNWGQWAVKPLTHI